MVVPGSFSDEQLSLLLGLASAIPVQMASIIDSALATCINNAKPTLLVELQLHQAVISLVQPADGSMVVSDRSRPNSLHRDYAVLRSELWFR